MKKILYIFLTFFITSSAFANQPVDWQLGFQKAASETMRDIVNFHDKLLLPIIICLLYTSPSPRDRQKSRMPSSA